jgi:hypothetical protein
MKLRRQVNADPDKGSMIEPDKVFAARGVEKSGLRSQRKFRRTCFV